MILGKWGYKTNKKKIKNKCNKVMHLFNLIFATGNKSKKSSESVNEKMASFSCATT